MREETIVGPDGISRPHFIQEHPDEILVLTGPVTGIKTLSDGTQVNVGKDFVALTSPEQVDELNDMIGTYWVENGHPDDVDTLTDPETGKEVLVQRPFVFETSAGKTLVGVGTPAGEHQLDEANGILPVTSTPSSTKTEEV